jgi:amino acid adenylation domain-containing protein
MDLVSAFNRLTHDDSRGFTFINPGGREQRLTYPEIARMAWVILGQLQLRGVKSGDKLIIQTANNKELIAIFWACILGKIVPVPVSSGGNKSQMLKVFKVWNCLSESYMTCDEDQRNRLDSFSEHVEVKGGTSRFFERLFLTPDLLTATTPGRAEAVSEGDIAYIQFSSGSTGDPKGVCLTHGNISANTGDIIDSLGIVDSDILFSWMPLTHDMGMIGFHLTCVYSRVNGVSMAVETFIKRPLLWMDKVESCRATVLYSPTFGLQYFLSALAKEATRNWDLSGVRIIVNGAETISVDVCRRFCDVMGKYGLHDHAILAAYGLAEASVEVAAMPVNTGIVSYVLDRRYLNIADPIRLLSQGAEHSVEFVDVGFPVKSCNVMICDDQDTPLPEEVIGHILVRGKNVSPGYYNDLKNTKEVFLTNGWLKTGDLGFFRNGRLTITGRLKNIIIINGQNYYPYDIEQCVVKAGISELGKVVACGIRRDGREEELILFIVYKGQWDDFVPIAMSIKDAVAEEMGIYASEIIPVRQFPKTTSGKIQYFSLRDQYLDGTFDEYIRFCGNTISRGVHRADPTGDLQALIVQRVGSLLNIAEVTIDTNLFEVGLDSFGATRLAVQLHKDIGTYISAADILRTGTIAAIGQTIKENRKKIHFPVPFRAEDTSFCNLTSAQYRIWMECQLNNESTAYNLPIVIRVAGPFEVVMVEKAFRLLIKKYEILRTSFVPLNGDIRQMISEFQENLFSISAVDLRNDCQRDEEVKRICREESNAVFRLDVPCQLRVTTIWLEEEEHLLLLVVHHILVDGWSLGLLLKELSEYYNSLIGNRMFAVDTASVFQYRQYISWREEYTGSDVFRAQKTYWEKELQARVGQIRWFGSRGLHDNADRRGRHKPVEHYSACLSREESGMLKKLANDKLTTPFSVLMTLLNILLYRYTGEKDILVGFDVSGRDAPDIGKVIGYTLNTLCLRYQVEGDQLFYDVLEGVKLKILSALENQFYPFESVVKDIQSQVNDTAPFLQLLVLYQDFYQNTGEIAFNDCATTVNRLYPKDSFVDLQIEFTERDGVVGLEILYSGFSYDLSAIERFVIHLKNLLYAVFRDPEREIGSYDLLTEKERLFFFPPVATTDLVSGIDKWPVHVLFEKIAALTPEVTAVVAGNISLTYADLNREANSIANFLVGEIGVRSDDRIGFIVERNEKMIISILGILKAGCAFVAIDPQFPLSRIHRIVDDSGVKCVLADSLNYDRLKGRYGALLVADLNSIQTKADPGVNPAYKGHMSDLAYVIYTSGSSGTPKGIMIEHGALSAYVDTFREYFSITCDDVFLQQASVSFDTMIEEIFPPLCTSGRIIIAENGSRDIDRMLWLIERYKITILSTTPAVLDAVNCRVGEWITSLRLVISGGDVLRPSNINNLFGKIQLYNTYGPSETTVCVTYKKITSISETSQIGKAIRGCRIYILDENRRPAPLGSVGEIYIEGNLSRGYLDLPETTCERFILSPFDRSKKLFRSGDAGRFTEDGELEFMGRLDAQFKIRGYRIEPEEIENVICGCAGIQSAAVISMENARGMIAYLTVGAQFSETELRVFMGEHLPYYMIPQRLRTIPEMPVTPSGKIDRMALRSMAHPEEPSRDDVKERPLTRIEEALISIWKEVLCVPDIDLTDDFFYLGGDSIRASKLINLILARLDVKLTLSDVFARYTILMQGEYLTAMERDSFYLLEV